MKPCVWQISQPFEASVGGCAPVPPPILGSKYGPWEPMVWQKIGAALEGYNFFGQWFPVSQISGKGAFCKGFGNPIGWKKAQLVVYDFDSMTDSDFIGQGCTGSQKQCCHPPSATMGLNLVLVWRRQLSDVISKLWALIDRRKNTHTYIYYSYILQKYMYIYI